MPESSGPRRAEAEQRQSAWEFAHALLFAGHMIDRPDREHPRFPRWAEGRAREAIRAAIEGMHWKHTGSTVGLAAAASGGDILFHECCAKLGIATRVLLALPADDFVRMSVQSAGPEWVERFYSVLRNAAAGVREMQSGNRVQEEMADDLWRRANLWMIGEAKRAAPERALLALWNGSTGDGPGGTADLLESAGKSGIRLLPPINIRELLKS